MLLFVSILVYPSLFGLSIATLASAGACSSIDLNRTAKIALLLRKAEGRTSFDARPLQASFRGNYSVGLLYDKPAHDLFFFRFDEEEV